jgi:glycosyltransferase involved in cell wall biosynthesis
LKRLDGEGLEGNEEPVRLAVVTSHPIQYFAPWYRALAETPGVELKVFFCCRRGVERSFDRDFGIEVKWDIPLLDGYEWEFLEGGEAGKAYSFLGLDNPGVGTALERFHPDVVKLHGYFHRTMWRAARWSRRHGVPAMLFSDSNATAPRAWWKLALKAVVVGSFYRLVDGALASGDNNRKYHWQYGLPEERIFAGTMAIDCQRLLNSVGDVATARGEIRERHGIPQEAFVVVYAGKLAKWKSPLDLLEALARCADRGLKVWGLFVGEGSERAAMEALIAERKIGNTVLAGFQNQSAIGKYYAAADAVALMSEREPKGLTIPEAGVFGCVAIVSDRVGCIGPNDSARRGENALVYPWSDVEALTECLAQLARDSALFKRMSAAARRIALEQDVTVAARQMKEAAMRLKAMGRR